MALRTMRSPQRSRNTIFPLKWSLIRSLISGRGWPARSQTRSFCWQSSQMMSRPRKRLRQRNRVSGRKPNDSLSVAEKRIGIRADIVKRKAPGRRRGPSFFSLVEAGVHIVDVLLAKTILHQPQSLAEALEMDDLSRPQEADGIGDVRVIGETEDVVIGDPGLLLCCAFV